jgi:hypothetical protein
MPIELELVALRPSGTRILGDNSGDLLGYSLSNAGDINGDGYDDIIVGAPSNDRGGGNSGAAYVLFGRPDGIRSMDLTNLSASDGFAIIGDNPVDNLGWSVSAAGDVNGDGFDDLIVGAPSNDEAGTDAGKAYIIFGRSTAFGTIDLATLSASTGFYIQGDNFSDFAGHSVSGVGDFNGDGFDDFIVGGTNGAFTGGWYYYSFSSPTAYVVFGDGGTPTNLNLTFLSPSDGFKIEGPTNYGTNFFSMGAAGDINGDGFDDFVLGDPVAEARGDAYVIFGRAGNGSNIDLENLPATSGFIIRGASGSDAAGFDVASVGDLNNDGYDDIIVGAMTAHVGGAPSGAAYVIYGKVGGFGTIDLANLTSSAGFRITGGATLDSLGISVAPAGDVNGDGLPDIVIGASSAEISGKAGAAYVIFGQPGGWRSIDLGHLDPRFGIALLGNDFNNSAGFSVSGGGDVNNDGFSDIVVGAPFASGGGTDAGEMYVFYGRESFVPNSSGLFNGDFNGDNRDDILWRSDGGRVTNWLGQGDGGFASNIAIADANAGADWHAVGVGDFNGDNRDDILWRHENGDMFDWLSQANGNFASNASNSYTNVSVSWEVIGTGDFNGDNRTDVLWRNDIGRVTNWLGQTNGGFLGNFANADANAGLDWHFAGTGDFNGDGRDDILWRNAKGELFNWLSTPGGGFASNAANSYTSVDSSWHIVGIGDFDGDNRSDILWRNDSGRVTNWLGQANGGFASNFGNSDANSGVEWFVFGTGDYNGDNRSDILWRNPSGDIATWLGQANGSFVNNPAAHATFSNAWSIESPDGFWI